ncbi:hypothetical protein GQ43DRAFT_438112 [Delitschia confertaspora ATCC 74209]|uniref:Cytidyltransferase-like domain-containing protein n=1 Tax=Delitschia confertaspora ATCC 74209 TaxID=1513339 RepID=A0A9P4MVN2_9PLEO|nr:hypothetical protein GQ43DRAFT_438112 [Delitschia confertaspora ATCC 74209]
MNTPRISALSAQLGPFTISPESKKAFVSALKDELPLASPSDSLREPLKDFGDSAFLAHRVLTEKACQILLDVVDQRHWVPANFHEKPIRVDLPEEFRGSSFLVGSYRTTAYDEDIACSLWERLRPALEPLHLMNNCNGWEEKGSSVWVPVGVNPLLRFIRFERGGATVPHYDSSFNNKDGKRKTLMSVIFTLTSKPKSSGGNVRFLLDTQRWRPLEEQDFTDHTQLGSPKDVLVEVPSGIGDCVVFDHKVLHDISIWNEDSSPRILLRTDLIYECRSPSDNKLILHPTKEKEGTELSGSPKSIEFTGYWDDSMPGDIQSGPNWWTGPVDKIQTRLSQVEDVSKELVVLVSTGAFCPIHKGHIHMMEVAKKEAEARGMAVLGGYFCPDHDCYVFSKLGSQALSSSERVYLCRKAVADSDWLMVDSWAALYASTSVHFTRILDHISRMLAHNIRTHRPVRVIYVFGGDNAIFFTSFVARGSCICVSRPGRCVRETVDEALKCNRNPRIIFAWDDMPNISSTGVRGGAMSALPAAVEQDWIHIQRDKVEYLTCKPEPVNFFIRNEGLWATIPWINNAGCDLEMTEGAYKTFCEGLHDAFAKAFGSSPNTAPPIQLIRLPLQLLQQLYKEKTGNQRVLSLDPCLPGTVNLHVSPCFKPLSEQYYGSVACPAAPSLGSQVDNIEPGNYVLFNIDSFSGKTEAYVTSLLSDRCNILKFQTLFDSKSPVKLQDQTTLHCKRLNLVNCRDFLAGSREGGLVLQLSDNSLCRAPYMLPYVRPSDHTSLPVTADIEFSRDVWNLNKIFYRSLNRTLFVKDMSPAFRQLCDSVRFPSDMSMEDLCSWHHEGLSGGRPRRGVESFWVSF